MIGNLIQELQRRNVIRVGSAYFAACWLITEVGGTLLPLYGASDSVIRIIIALLGVGFIPTVILAWVFELTPEGIKKDSDIDRSVSTTGTSSKMLDRAIIILLALALSYFVFDKFVLSESREAATIEQARREGRSEALVISYGDKSIAVLPFTDMSTAKDQEYMSDGIPEELLTLLSKIPELRVTSRSSSFYFKGKDIKPEEIAEQLNVAHILEGSVRKAGNRVRISVRLVEPASGTQLWSENYDRTLDDIFAIQDEIATSVVEELKISLLGQMPKVAQTDPETYSLYLQANQLFNSAQLQEAILRFKRVLEQDPAYIPALTGLAACYYNMAATGQMPLEEAMGLAKSTVESAISFTPDCAKCESLLAAVAMAQGDTSAAMSHFEQALALAPTDLRVLANSSILLHSLGRTVEAIEILEYFTLRDPLNLAGPNNLAGYHLSIGQYDAAIESAHHALELSPSMIDLHWLIGVALLYQGKHEEALAELLLEENKQRAEAALAMAYHALVRPAESDAALNRAIELDGDGVRFRIAQAFAYRGQADEAFEWLNRALEVQQVEASGTLSFDPAWANLRDDPRWQPLLESHGLTKEQLAEIEFEVRLPAATRSGDPEE